MQCNLLVVEDVVVRQRTAIDAGMLECRNRPVGVGPEMKRPVGALPLLAARRETTLEVAQLRAKLSHPL